MKEGRIRKVEPTDLYLAENVFAPRIKCWPSNVGTAIMARLSCEKGPEKALWPAYCLFMAVRAPVRRVMTGHYLFVVFSLEQGRPRFECEQTPS